ncbi:hypothetical protein IAE22_30115, partial [Bacillus sp. S34]|nr:hypothetical protein [Bacillus sp. S34]
MNSAAGVRFVPTEPVSVGGLPGWIRPGSDGTTWSVFLPGLGSHPLRHQDVADAEVVVNTGDG